MIEINERIQIPADELDFSYVRSSGPGGQNVNKVATKAVLKWNVVASESLPPAVKRRLLERQKRRINAVGELVLASDRHRHQTRNVEDCLERLRSMIVEVLEPPKPRVPTKTPRRAKRRRLENKRRQSLKKRQRLPVHGDSD